jgi:hypothetical protein
MSFKLMIAQAEDMPQTALELPTVWRAAEIQFGAVAAHGHAAADRERPLVYAVVVDEIFRIVDTVGNGAQGGAHARFAVVQCVVHRFQHVLAAVPLDQPPQFALADQVRGVLGAHVPQHQFGRAGAVEDQAMGALHRDAFAIEQHRRQTKRRLFHDGADRAAHRPAPRARPAHVDPVRSGRHDR